MPIFKVAALTLAMIAFAGNSIFCRIVLKDTGIDAASFTSIRLVSGAAVLWAITIFFRRDRQRRDNWFSKQWGQIQLPGSQSDALIAI